MHWTGYHGLLSTYELGLHGDGLAGHGEQGEDPLVGILTLDGVPPEVHREEVALRSHVDHVPEGDVALAGRKLPPAEHPPVHALKRGTCVSDACKQTLTYTLETLISFYKRESLVRSVRN